MQYTDNYQFREPTPAVDIVKVGDINYNSRKIDELIHSTQVSLAPAYDETRTSSNPYMTGDVVMKDALMYRCLDDDVYGAWDATKWERTTAGEEGAGGSSVEANPQGTPTDDLDTIGINGTIYNIAGSGGGGGNVYGAFIDTNRVIKANTTVEVGTVAEYTATEDCIVICEYYGSDNDGNVKVDDVIVSQIYVPYGTTVNNVETIFLKSGQTIKIKTVSYTGRYVVYGLTFGTQNIFTPQIYSTEERCVGVWKDNKPLYQKSVPFTAGSGYVKVPLSISNFDVIFLAEAFIQTANETAVISSYRGSPSSEEFGGLVNPTTTGGSFDYRCGADLIGGTGCVTVLYTKTTDIAGSGSFNTLGVPMVHYSTDEQVVGTDENGNTVYQKTFKGTLSGTQGSIDISALNVSKAWIYDGYYDIGVTQLALNEYVGNNSVTRCHVNTGLTPPYIDIYCTVASNADYKVTIRYTKSSS